MLTLSLLTQHIVYQLCWWVVHVSDQSCFFMQDGVGERDVKFTEVEKTRLEWVNWRRWCWELMKM